MIEIQLSDEIKEIWSRHGGKHKYVREKDALGKDFITPMEIMKARSNGIIYTSEQLTKLMLMCTRVTLSDELLMLCKENNYVVMAAPPEAVAFRAIRSFYIDRFCLKAGSYGDCEFTSSDKTSPGWLMVRKDPVPDSTARTWDEQIKLIPMNEDVPNVTEAAWLFTAYSAVNGIDLLNKNTFVRTSSVNSSNHVHIGRIDNKKRGNIAVLNGSDDFRGDLTGILSCRRIM